MPGYIKRTREDGKIDLSLLPPGYAKVEGLRQKYCRGEETARLSPLSDSSSPALIQQKFGVSKRVYKMAIGALFKQKLITIEENGIRITEKGKMSDKSPDPMHGVTLEMMIALAGAVWLGQGTGSRYAVSPMTPV